jgi:hypothetical protein
MSNLLNYNESATPAGVCAVAADIHRVFVIPAGAIVLAAGLTVVSATAGSGTMSFGDANVNDRFVTKVAVNSTGIKEAAVTSFPVMYTSNTFAVCSIGVANINDAKVLAWALVADVTAKGTLI